MLRFLPGVLIVLILGLSPLSAQDKSVKPGINDPFKNPDTKEFLGKFEIESREVFSKRNEIVEHLKLKPGLVVADVGAGTGLFSRLFAAEVGERGRVYAVDIARNFLDHIKTTAKSQKLGNLETVLCTPTSTELKPNSVDVVFVCDTYHHFEFPSRTLDSIHKALKPRGQLIVIDFRRIPGTSSDWILGHVRAGQEVVEKEIAEAGFKKLDEVKGLLEENYFVRFVKVEGGSK